MRQSILIFCFSVVTLVFTAIAGVNAKEMKSKTGVSVIAEHNYTVTGYRGHHRHHRGRALRRAIRRAVRRKIWRTRRCHRHYSHRWGRIKHCHKRYRHHRHGRRHYR